MAITKFFLAQFLVEVEVTDGSSFDDVEARPVFSSALRLPMKHRKHYVDVFMLALKPGLRTDVVIEEYEYRGVPITIYQNADTVGGDVPTYFATATNLKTKRQYGYIVADDSEDIETVRRMAHSKIDKKVS